MFGHLVKPQSHHINRLRAIIHLNRFTTLIELNKLTPLIHLNRLTVRVSLCESLVMLALSIMDKAGTVQCLHADMMYQRLTQRGVTPTVL